MIQDSAFLATMKYTEWDDREFQLIEAYRSAPEAAARSLTESMAGSCFLGVASLYTGLGSTRRAKATFMGKTRALRIAPFGPKVNVFFLSRV